MANFEEYGFDEKISKAYKDLLKWNQQINTHNDPSELRQAMSNLEQDLKQNGEKIDAISFDNHQHLVTRIGWLNNNPKEFDDPENIFELNIYFDTWLDRAYDLLEVDKN